MSQKITQIPRWLYALMGLILFIGIGAGALGFWAISDLGRKSQKVSPADQIPSLDTLSDVGTDLAEVVPTTTEIVPFPTTTSTEEDSLGEVFQMEPDNTAAVLSIVWSKPVKTDPKVVLKNAVEHALPSDSAVQRIMKSMDMPDDSWLTMEESIGAGFWHIGTVKAGPYQKSALYIWRRPWVDCSMGCQQPSLVLVSPDGQDVRMVKYADEEMSGGYDSNDMDYMIQALDLKISFISSIPKVHGRSLFRSDSAFRYSYTTYKLQGEYLEAGGVPSHYKIYAKSDDGQALYQSDDLSGCLYNFDLAGFVNIYRSIIPEKTTVGGDAQVRVTWDSNVVGSASQIFDYYPAIPGGCGYSACVDVLSDEQVGPLSDLVQAGKTSEGDPIYIPRQPLQHAEFIKTYENWAYFDPDGKEKPPIETFVKDYKLSVFFWKDVFGRWIRYSRSDFVPVAECGKPVIYLYPEKTTSIDVRLPSFIEVTVSEPSYPRTGWNVVAHPDGTLEYPADGNNYGSLYWEGVGVGYERPTTGWVIRDGEQKAFLAEILPQYGLNEREAQEFMDFWLPEMQGASYYRISFLTDDWVHAAPLYVTPAPQTSIRIFMDWQKLTAPQSIPVPEVSTPSRDGYTLVEWGGLLYK